MDRDRDGIADMSESGVEGWKMIAETATELPGADEDGSRVPTNNGGEFKFPCLPPGAYEVYQDSDSRAGLERWALYSPNAGVAKSGDRPWVQPLRVNVTEGDVTRVVFLIVPLEGTGSISGLFYYDTNRNGVRDPTDALADTGSLTALGYRTPSGFTSVYQEDGMLSDGDPLPWRYEFSNLARGDYVVGVIGPAGRPLNPPPSVVGFAEREVTISSGEVVSGQDFGFEPRSPTTVREAPHVHPTAPIGAPSTGSADADSSDKAPWFIAATTVAFFGGLATAYGLRRSL